MHVVAGWHVPSTADAGYKAACQALRGPNSNIEFKAGRRINSTAGRRAVGAFLLEAMKSGATPIFMVLEKKFCITAKIVETFLDPFHNERADFLPTGDDVKRKAIANNLLTVLPDQALEEFSKHYRNPTPEGFAQSIASIASACRSAGQPLLASAFEGCLQNISSLADSETINSFDAKHKITTSLNVAAFIPFVIMADEMIETRRPEPVTLVHDETKEFEPAMQFLVNLFADVKPTTPYVLRSGRLQRIGLEWLKKMQTAPSNVEPAIQGADALAAAVRTAGDVVARGDRLQGTPEGETLKEFAKSATHIAFDVVGSEAFCEGFSGA